MAAQLWMMPPCKQGLYTEPLLLLRVQQWKGWAGAAMLEQTCFSKKINCLVSSPHTSCHWSADCSVVACSPCGPLHLLSLLPYLRHLSRCVSCCTCPTWRGRTMILYFRCGWPLRSHVSCEMCVLTLSIEGSLGDS